MIYPEPEARDKIYQYLPTHAKTQNTFILASRNYFDSDMSKSTNTIVYFDWKTGIYIYACEYVAHILQSSILVVVWWPTARENWFGPMTFVKCFQ